MFLFITLITIAIANTGSEWLQKIDQKAAVNTAHMYLVLEVQDRRGNVVSREMEIWQNASQSRLVRLQSPARLKGVGLLVSNEDTLHLFLPQYPPARRVLNSTRSDSFLGTDFAIDDLARLNFAPKYSADYIENDEIGHHLHLKPLKENQEYIHLWCDDEGKILRLNHYSSKDALLRTLQFSDYKDVNGVALAHSVVVVDEIKQRRTTAQMLKAEVNTTIPPEIFTLTNLENP